jgi:hypothetical protein
MKRSTRRGILKRAAAAVAAVLGAAFAARAVAQPGSDKKPETRDPGTAPESGPRELFAVVDEAGKLVRGQHAASVRRLDVGVYEVTFRRDVSVGVHLATIGNQSARGLPPTGSISVQTRARAPSVVYVCTCNAKGDSVNLGFHLLVVCPDGSA